MKPTVLILQATGTNRDMDAAEAFTKVGAAAEIVHIYQLKSGEKKWQDYQILVLAGGFSYADALGAGKLLSIDLRTYFIDEVRAFIAQKKAVIGICNGFQTLVKSGLIFENETNIQITEGTLTFNQSGHFECRWVNLRPASAKCVWIKKDQSIIECPVAHGEGNFFVKDNKYIETLLKNDMIALRYAAPSGNPAEGSYPYNPNGSIMDIAGICNPAGNVLGLMPHPENNIFPYQHYRRTRGNTTPTGLEIFKNGVEYANQM
ncbi:MAG: phosphoribosylformylglycinamidine synthase I [Anaerolineaceae bacterium]|nr:phosphoribosylformylglycinamidine synthase I [Anaerolineaceae bacterium]